MFRKPNQLARNSPVSTNITYLSFIFVLVINITWQSKQPCNYLFIDLLNEVHIFVVCLLHVAVLNWRHRILIMYTGSRSGILYVYMTVFDTLHIEHLRMDSFRVGQLQPTGVPHNSLRTRLKAALVSTYIKRGGVGVELTRRPLFTNSMIR